MQSRFVLESGTAIQTTWYNKTSASNGIAENLFLMIQFLENTKQNMLEIKDY